MKTFLFIVNMTRHKADKKERLALVEKHLENRIKHKKAYSS